VRKQHVRVGVAYKEFELDGGESVYCINEVQLRKAFEIIEEHSESSERIEKMLETIDTALSRNERAALSFVLIHRLLGTRSAI